MAQVLSMTRLFSLLLASAAVVQAYTTYETNCSTPTEVVNFVTAPNSRGTLDILWSCLFTIFACTWTIQHLNIPTQRAGRDPGRWGDLKWKMKRFWTRTKWMIFTIIAPEITLGKAFGEFMSARRSSKKMKEFSTEDRVEWSLAHSFYADMGGFTVLPVLESNAEGAVDTIPDIVPESGHELLALGDSATTSEMLHMLNTQSVRPLILILDEIYELRSIGVLKKLPDLSVAELKDKSKGDFLIKLIALVQVLWVILQVLVRVARRLSISQLELAVTAFSACAFATYILLLEKPQNVSTPSRPIICDRKSFFGSRLKIDHDNLRGILNITFRSEDTWYKDGIPNDAVSIEGLVYTSLGSIMGGVIFGSIHLCGWNLHTPTAIEQTLWRISSVVMTILPILLLFIRLIISVYANRSKWTQKRQDVTISVGQAVMATLYVAARLIILVEIFRTICFLPPDAYVSTWSSSIPHVA